MSREEHAREGAQAVIPDDEILDVAVVMPRGSTFAGVLGAAAGVAAGGSNPTAWGVAGGMIGERVSAASKGSYPSLVLALSAGRLYVLGRESTGLVGGWKHLHPVAHIERKDLQVTRRRRGTVVVIGLTDTTTGTTLEVEAQNVGGLGLKDLLEAVQAEESSADDADGGKA
ncbi:hypothetical protein [Microbacterium invictum]|uniref:DUF304 domain-containing protein n=1 Tax=Microbacterium invictum TaxID=515415 RepID=A0ABZ0V8S3_9MICO|nr:hypothetical protein [Microbacterium invictum]WQB69639.1 hypothetical protein T9R20_13170 [Microbacterium invictum]